MRRFRTTTREWNLSSSFRYPFPSNSSLSLSLYLRKRFTFSERRMALVCVLYVLKNIEKKWILEWVRKETMNTFTTFLELITLAVEVFQYSGKDKIYSRRASAQPTRAVDVPSKLSLGTGRGSIRGTTSLSVNNSIKYKDTLRPDGTLSETHQKKKQQQSSGKDVNPIVDKRPVNFGIDLDTEVKLVNSLSLLPPVLLISHFSCGAVLSNNLLLSWNCRRAHWLLRPL